MYIEGKPGSGKSTLLRYFADEFKPKGAVVAKFFYSQSGGDVGRNHGSMLQYLLYEILKKDESLFIHFQQEYRNLGSSKVWKYEKLGAVLRACLEHPLERNIFLIIDAMDESDDCDREDIVRLLWRLLSPTSGRCVVKVLLASRPINEIRHVDIPVHQRIRLQEKNREDIEIYTCHLLGGLRFCGDETKREVKDYIVKHADGVFLWVGEVGKELRNRCDSGVSRANMFESLETLPEKLVDYYEKMLQGLKGSRLEDVRDGTRILQFCLFSHRAVELLELQDALGIPGEISYPSLNLTPFSWERHKPEDITSRLTNCVGGFVEIKSSHASVAGKSPPALTERPSL